MLGILSNELYGVLWLLGCQVLNLAIYYFDALFLKKDKMMAKKIAERLGLICVGVLAATVVVFLGWLF